MTDPNNPSLITSADVPGMTPERLAEIEAQLPKGRQVISIPEEDFKGDPRRVIGHPSNPNTGAAEAAADYLKGLEAQRQTAENGRMALHAADPNIIREVPFEVPPRQELPQRPQQPVIDGMPDFDKRQ